MGDNNEQLNGGGFAPPLPDAPSGTPIPPSEYTPDTKPAPVLDLEEGRKPRPPEPTKAAPPPAQEAPPRRGRPPRNKELPAKEAAPLAPTGQGQEQLPPPLGLPVDKEINNDRATVERMRTSCSMVTDAAIYALLDSQPHTDRGQAVAWEAIGRLKAAHAVMNWGAGHTVAGAR